MIAQLRGRILRKGPGDVVLDVAGVGYRLTIPVTTFCKLGEVGADARLLTHTHVREDTLALFGFATTEEQLLFELLISVAGVGPRLAVNILSGIETPDLIQALRLSDLARLTRIPGVGRKTAERLVVELKDKASKLVPAADPLGAPAASTLKDDLVSALANLGYPRPNTERGVERALEEDRGGSFEDLLRRSLQILSGR